jgi:hypothetical protein
MQAGKPRDDSQDLGDEVLREYASHSSLGQVREKLCKLLSLATAGEKTGNPTARSWSAGNAAGIETAIKLIDKALIGEASVRVGAIDPGKSRPEA